MCDVWLAISFLNVGTFGSDFPMIKRCVPCGRFGSNFATGSRSAAFARSTSRSTPYLACSKSDGSSISLRKVASWFLFASEKVKVVGFVWVDEQRFSRIYSSAR